MSHDIRKYIAIVEGEGEPEQLGFIRNVGGFDIIPTEGGFKLVDTDTFNSWGTINHVFDTEEEAAEYAQRCDDFKRGRRMRIEREPWER